METSCCLSLAWKKVVRFHKWCGLWLRLTIYPSTSGFTCKMGCHCPVHYMDSQNKGGFFQDRRVHWRWFMRFDWSIISPFTFSVEIPVPKQGELMQLKTCEEINCEESLGSKYNCNYWQRNSMRTCCEMERQVWMDWLVQLLCLPPQGHVTSVVWFIQKSYCFTLVELEPYWACCGVTFTLFQHHNLLIRM